MTIDIQHLQSSKKKHKKDRKDSDDRKRNDRGIDVCDLVVTKGERKKKKRKERKEEREGAIDGALCFSLDLQRADSNAIMCAYSCRWKRWQRKKESDSVTRRRARRVPCLSIKP